MKRTCPFERAHLLNKAPASEPIPANSPPAPAEGGEIMFGRFMLPDTSEHPCEVKELSLDGAVFITGQIVQGGTHLVAYIDDVGRVEALSAEPVPGGFRVTFSHAGARRDRFAARLDWVYSRKGQQATEQPRRFRYEVPDKSSYITLPDG